MMMIVIDKSPLLCHNNNNNVVVFFIYFIKFQPVSHVTNIFNQIVFNKMKRKKKK